MCGARDYWARFERFVRQLASSCRDVYVITGPLYLPAHTASGYQMNYPLIGKHHRPCCITCADLMVFCWMMTRPLMREPPCTTGPAAAPVPSHTIAALQHGGVPPHR